MTTFDEREVAFEKKFALDEEQKFKAEVRRNKLLGLWVAEKLGLSGDAASGYAKEVIAADFQEARNAEVVRKVIADLGAKGITMTEAQVRTRMGELMARAAAEVKAGT
jgi:hypothetical protein